MYDEAGEPIQGYRQFSGWSFMALLASLPSPLALFHLGFLAIPTIASATALLALRLGTRSTQVTGLALGKLAIAWSIFWGIAAISDEYLEYRRYVHLVRGYADQWLDLVMQQNFQEAIELTKSPLARKVITEDGIVEPQGSQQVAVADEIPVEDFVQTTMIEMLQAIDFRGKFEFVNVAGLVQASLTPDERQVVLLYQFQPESAAQSPFYVLLQMDQVMGRRTDKRYWKVTQWEVVRG